MTPKLCYRWILLAGIHLYLFQTWTRSPRLNDLRQSETIPTDGDVNDVDRSGAGRVYVCPLSDTPLHPHPRQPLSPDVLHPIARGIITEGMGVSLERCRALGIYSTIVMVLIAVTFGKRLD